MAVDILPLCFLVLYISGTYSSGLNKASTKRDTLKDEVSHEEQSKNRASTENKPSTENMKSTTISEDVHRITMGEERKSQYLTSNSPGTELTSIQDPSTSEVSQHSIQTTTQTPDVDKTTPFASNSTSETALTSHSISNTPGVVSSTTDSSTSLTNITHSSVNKISSTDSMEGSSKDIHTLHSSTEVNFSQSEALTNATSETLEHVHNNSRKKSSKVVIVLAAIGGSVFVIAASLVYIKYRKNTRVTPPEYLMLLP